jgi:hypothetical protein
MKTLLINRNDIAEYKQISESVHDKILNMHIQDAQFMDVQKLLGVNFYNDLIRNSEDVNYVTLLDGGDYTYNSITYTNVGLKAVLVHYTYSRYVLLGSNNDTPFGLVMKQTNDSVPTTDQNKKIIYTQNQQMAFNYWENVRDFLNRNLTDYPLWNDVNCVVQNNNFRISKIG